jgi:hypothetical protein
MAASLEETLILVWRQVMVEDTKVVALGDEKFPVRRTSRSRLREVAFQFEGHELRGLEQNPETGSRRGWKGAALWARSIGSTQARHLKTPIRELTWGLEWF